MCFILKFRYKMGKVRICLSSRLFFTGDCVLKSCLANSDTQPAQGSLHPPSEHTPSLARR